MLFLPTAQILASGKPIRRDLSAGVAITASPTQLGRRTTKARMGIAFSLI